MPFFCEIKGCWKFWNKCDVEGYKVVCEEHIDKANDEISAIMTKEVKAWHEFSNRLGLK